MGCLFPTQGRLTPRLALPSPHDNVCCLVFGGDAIIFSQRIRVNPEGVSKLNPTCDNWAGVWSSKPDPRLKSTASEYHSGERRDGISALQMGPGTAQLFCQNNRRLYSWPQAFPEVRRKQKATREASPQFRRARNISVPTYPKLCSARYPTA